MPDLVISDVDGVLTDSSINIGEQGELFKSFSVKDGYRIADWDGRTGKEFVIVTSRSSNVVEHRADELSISDVYQNVSSKKSIVQTIANEKGYSLQETAYIGDDLTDLKALEIAGTSCCPGDAATPVKDTCDYVSSANGGEGAVRDILEHLDEATKATVGVIPARYGSTRLPGKPLVELAGKPMIQHVYERASEASRLDDVIVATDDERISEIIEEINGKAVMTSTDHPTGTDRVAEVVSNTDYDYTVNIQGDEPLIDPDVIDAVVEELQTRPPSVATPISVISQSSELEDENTVKVVTDDDGRALYFSRSQIPYGTIDGQGRKHIGLYGFETELLLDYVNMASDLEDQEDLEQLRLLENGYDIQTVEVDYESKEVNVESDISVVEERLQARDES